MVGPNKELSRPKGDHEALLDVQVTARRKKRGKPNKGFDGCEGPMPKRPRLWSRSYYTDRESTIASLMTKLEPEEMQITLKVLFLDDDPFRHDNAKGWLESIVSGAHLDLTHVRNVEEFVKAFLKEDFDLICLDHDLQDFHYKGEVDEQTGREAARAIVSEGFDGGVIVHSWNPDGADAILQILKDGGIRVARKEFGSK